MVGTRAGATRYVRKKHWLPEVRQGIQAPVDEARPRGRGEDDLSDGLPEWSCSGPRGGLLCLLAVAAVKKLCE